jgi:DNA-binding response OmpR family regulator
VSEHQTSILVVEDELQIRHFVRQILEWAGYRVFAPRNGGQTTIIRIHRNPGIAPLIALD